MLKANPNAPKLTKNDQIVLGKLTESSKTPDSKIAEEIGISPQAVFKIRTKLEKLGIIKGYLPVIDYQKIGISTLSLIVIRLKPEVWDTHSDEFITKEISKIPHIISAYRCANAFASHIILIGFRDNAQKEKYLAKMQTHYSNFIEIRDLFSFSSDKIITMKPYGLLKEIVYGKDFTDGDLFPFLKKKPSADPEKIIELKK